MTAPHVVLDAVTRVHGEGETAVTALDAVTLEIHPGELVAVMGPSLLRAWRPISRTAISLHEIRPCAGPSCPVRLSSMITAATHQDLVARRHVDLGRTRSMMCMSA